MSKEWQAALAAAIAGNSGDATSRYLQLATVTESGAPANRTVVYRGQGDHGELLLVTDRSSNKVAEAALHPVAELCWYFAGSREQFRIRGTLTFVGHGSTASGKRQAVWDTLSPAAREQFAWPQPGKPVGAGARPALADGPPENFMLGLLQPDRVDYLRLHGAPQQRCLYQLLPEGWQAQAINP